ncbi:MAG: glycosyltransferase family 39 protein [Phycisphaerae bacterium]
MTHPRNILLALLAVQLITRLTIIAQAGPMTDNGLYGDDSYMSHKFAQNMAEGKGITQAGTPNNGFQPLYVFLIFPLFWFLDPLSATVGTAILNSVFHLLACVFLYRVIRRVANERCALAAVVIWTASAFLTRVSLNGLETALANFMMLLLIDRHLASREAHSDETGSPWGLPAAAQLGFVMGLAFLARLDLGLLLLPLGLDQIAVRWRRRELGALAVTVLIAGATVAPWFLWSKIACGSWTPISGQATRTVAQLYGSPTGPVREPSYFPLGEIPWSFYESHLVHAWKHLVLDAPINLVGRLLTSQSPLIGALGLLIPVILFVAMRWSSGSAGQSNARELAAFDDVGLREVRWSALFAQLWYAWLFVLVLPLVYSLYFFAQWHFWRYLSAAAILLLIPFACLLDPLLSRLKRIGGPGTVAAICLVSGTLLLGGLEHRSLFAEPDDTGIAFRLYADAVALTETLAPEDRVGSFESGTLDYFMPRDVYNLDGKTDGRALEALRAGRIDRHIYDLGLDFVVSSPPLIRDLLSRRGQWSPGELTVVGRLQHNLVVKIGPRADGVPAEGPAAIP